MPRKWQPRELRMLSEWLAETYHDYEYRTRVRLGRIEPRVTSPGLTEQERRMIGVHRRWADAVVLLPDRVVLVEAKIRPQPGVISQLELYARLLPHTPELGRHAAFPVEMVLLYAIEDELINVMAREKGIRCVAYQPSWLDEYLEELYPRERTGGHTPL